MEGRSLPVDLLQEVDIELLRRQRNWLLEGQHDGSIPNDEEGEGIVNFLNYILDVAEGYDE